MPPEPWFRGHSGWAQGRRSARGRKALSGATNSGPLPGATCSPGFVIPHKGLTKWLGGDYGGLP